MELGLAGKAVLVTGGSKGIGLACAKAFLTEGCRVTICSRSQSNVDAALAQLPGAAGFTADLTDATAAEALLEKAGPLDILVNSAGAAARQPAAELTAADWHAAMDAKFFSYVHVMSPAAQAMAKRGAGVIVNIIGQGGKVASPVHVAGGAANAALMLATAGLAAAFAAQGVRVVGLNPGTTETGRVTGRIAALARAEGISEDAARTRLQQGVRMGRFARPEEIANAAVFLASSAAAYISGVNISMDGLQTATVV
jgi:NAD(P)-dependent dehydrogenase (short-subunit alcohol dehydrogenase family)